MNISKNMRNKIIAEIEHVISSMQKNNDPFKKLYFFSGIHGILNRVFNIEYDSELVYIHHVVFAVHSGFVARMDAIRKGETAIFLDESYFEKLTSLSITLKDKIAQDEDVNDTLKDFIILLYTTTGNGYYLKDKKVIKN